MCIFACVLLAILGLTLNVDMISMLQQNKYRNDYPLMIFQGTAMLQKPAPRCRIVGKPVDD